MMGTIGPMTSLLLLLQHFASIPSCSAFVPSLSESTRPAVPRPLSASTCHTAHQSSWSAADWSAALRTQPLVAPIAIVDTIGTLPLTFPAGILYKAGPARFENEGSGTREGTPYAHWLEGDGAISRLQLNPEAGPGEPAATFAFRFVETDLQLSEREEGKILARGTFGTNKDEGRNAFDFKLKNPCNTNAAAVGDTLLALSEVGLPHRLDPDTLAPQGVETFGGRLVDGAPAATLGPVLGAALDPALGFGDAVCAHLHEMDGRHAFVAMRQNAITSATCLRLLELDSKSGDIVSETESVLENTGFPPHDWAITPSYAAFVATPAGGDLTPFLLGSKGPAECISFQRDVEAIVHIVPRANCKVEAMSVPLPAALHPVHFANAWEAKGNAGEGDVPALEIFATCWDDATVRRMGTTGESLLGSWAKVSGGDFGGVPTQRLMRISTGKEPAVEEAVPGLGHVDYVKCHPRYTGRRSRYVWGSIAAAAGNEPAPLAPPQSFCRLDLHTKQKVDEWFAGERRFVDDFVLIEKDTETDAGSNNTPEDQAWLVAPVFDAETNTSSFVVLDGQNLSAGPIFEVRLSSHIPWGLHGTYTRIK
uniref:Carotenoid oxygenase n=1 Tax=Odontella aurita TaxID=265563 RepID=A0A7S4JC32_9STRA|mmetsp:Transcript_43090/g.131225  ORF Transcript_43090/g.131225 Transcript_43090/m.131225 type:complete len:593 (+) Transcript_43090:43-1821(+)